MMPSIFGENMFDDWFDFPFEHSLLNGRSALYGKHEKNLMKTDIRDTGSGYELDIDLPGFKKEDVSVELKDGYLTVCAAKGLDRDEEEKDGRFIRKERYAGACTRSFYVGDVRPEEVSGKYEFGVLKLRIPKKDSPAIEAPNRIAIE